MKVLFLDQSGKLGGAELSLLDIAGTFGPDSSVVLFQDGPFRSRLETAGIRVRVLDHRPIDSRRDAGAWQGIKSVIQALPLIQEIAKEAKDYEIIYANTQKAFILGALAGWITKCPVVYHLRDILSLEHFSSINIKVAIFFANRFSRVVIANSQATAQSFIEAGGKKSLAKVVYNGFDPKIYQFSPNDHARLGHELSLEDKFIVGHFSRLSPWKGQHILLEALAQCPDNVVALLVGDALFGENDYVQELHRQVARLGLESRVKFLGFRSDIPALMHLCDLVAHTSTAPEPFGRVIVEAMLCGTPVVAAAAGGALELIEPGRTGWLTEPGDGAALAAVIRGCLADPGGAMGGAIAAQSFAQNAFNLEATCQKLEGLLVHLPTKQKAK